MENQTPVTQLPSDKELKEAGAKLTFGKEGIAGKTPTWMSNLANGIIFLTLAWGVVSMMITSIPPDIKSSINEWVLVGSGLLKLASKCFGFKLPEQV